MADLRPVSEQIFELGDDNFHLVAISSGAASISYAELDSRAGKFAAYLTQLGVAPGDTVVICMERSFDWVVAALGIMRAGAAYVPLDSAWPDSRLRYAVNDSGAKVLVARAILLERLQIDVHGIDPVRDGAAIAKSNQVAYTPIQMESLAYVIYTSGSTGTPKGVEITHANLAHLIRWHQEALNVSRQDRASHLAGLGFDAAAWEIWGNLSAGATLCFPNEDVRSSPELIKQWMVSDRITLGFVPTIHAEPLMSTEWPATTALRLLLTGGDALHRGPALELPFKVVNNYGPTECTVVATSSTLKYGTSGEPPIGLPITGARIYLLNAMGQPVSDGEVGEIYIGGEGVGRGYRNLPDLTERCFLPDPFAKIPGARMYRTGDRGTRRSDGEIEFRGRLDRQVKIRGFRVELDEIGTRLNEHQSVDFATVIAETLQSGENRLIAYVLPKDSSLVPTANELQEHLLRTLPDYMVPPVFVRLDKLPISPSGKIDLAMLAQIPDRNILQRVSPEAPASPTRDKLLAIVRELLQNNSVSAGDNFFLAGGHSLLGMQLVMKVGDAFGIDLALRQLFEAPTVERLALLLDTIGRQKCLSTIWAELLGRDNFGLDDNFFDVGGNPALLAALQQRIATDLGYDIPIADLLHKPNIAEQADLIYGTSKREQVLPPGVLELRAKGNRDGIFWVHYLNVNLAKVIGDDQSFFSVGLVGEDLATLGDAPTLQAIASLLVGKIVLTQASGSYTIGGLCLGGILAYEIAFQLRALGRHVSLLVLLDPPHPSYLDSCHSMERRVRYLRYVMKRAVRIGPRMTLMKLSERLFGYLPRSIKRRLARTPMSAAQQMIETAALVYRPEKYDGRVLLLLASDRPPHVNFLPGWQKVIPTNLHTEYIDGHHNELMKSHIVRSIATAIVSHLSQATEDEPGVLLH
jgi:amino acid adenylation domain-containing protein